MSSADAADHAPVEDARDELQEAVPEAAAKLRELLGAEDERVQIRAAEGILNRAGVRKAIRTSTTTAALDIGGESRDDGLDELLYAWVGSAPGRRRRRQSSGSATQSISIT